MSRRIEDPVRGEGLILESVAAQPAQGGGVRMQTWNKWTALVPMLVQVEGQEPYRANPKLWMSRSKYPVAGTTVPVLVDRADPSNVEILWDEVPKIDEWIAAGHEVFSDPDRVEARLRRAIDTHTAGAIHGVDEQAAGAWGGQTALGAGGMLEAIQRVREATEAPQQQSTERPPPPTDRPSARVIAMSSPWSDTSAGWSSDEMLLSVLVPGNPRYGARWRGSIPRYRFVSEWADVLVEVNERKPEKIKVLWDEQPNTMDAISDRLADADSQIAGALSGSSDAAAFQALLGAVPGAAAAFGEAMGAPAKSDPAEQLARLAKLHEAGHLTDAEYAEAKGKILDQF